MESIRNRPIARARARGMETPRRAFVEMTTTRSGRLAPLRSHLPFASALTVVLLATAVSYLPNLGDFFSTDDFLILAPARRLPAGSFIWNTLLLRGPVPFWRPLLAPVYVFETWLFGLHPLPYHLVNLGLHLLITLFLCQLARMLTQSNLIGLVAALLFGVSPTYAGSVAWMATLNELTAVTLYLLTLVLAVHAVQHRENSGFSWLGSFLCYLLALLAWEAAITVVPVVVLCYFGVRGIQHQRWRRFAAEVAPFVGVAAAYCAFNWVAQVREANNRLLVYGVGPHILQHYWWYLGRLALPVPDNAGAWVDPMRTIAASTLLCGCALAIWRGSMATRLMVAWLLVTIVPFTLWIIWTGGRWTYTPSLPLAILLATGIVRLYHNLANRQIALALSLAMIGFVLLPVVLGQAKVAQDHPLTLSAGRWHELLDTLRSEYPSLPAHSTVYLVDGTFTDLFDGSYLENIGQLLYGDVAIKAVDSPSFYAQHLGERPNVFALQYRDGHPSPVLLHGAMPR
ncbi:MAG: hypothetical protein ACR2PL_13280 [Dehalococcoidia bacterium]